MVRFLLICAIILIVFESVLRVRPDEHRALVVRGSFRRMLDPGFHAILPFVSRTKSVPTALEELTVEVPIERDERMDHGHPVIVVSVVVNDTELAYKDLLDVEAALTSLIRTTARPRLRAALTSEERSDGEVDRDELEADVQRLLETAIGTLAVTISVLFVGLDEYGPRVANDNESR